VVIVGVSLNDYDRPPALSPIGLLTRTKADESRPGLADRSHLLVMLQWLNAYRRGGLYFQGMGRLEKAMRPPQHQTGTTIDSRTIRPLVRARPEPTKLDGGVRNLHLAFYRDPDPRVWARMRKAWADLKRITDREGISLMAAIFPEAYQVGVRTPKLDPQQRLLGICTELGIRCLDLHAAFTALGGDLFNDPQHPNARGHIAAALAITAALDRK